MAPSILAILDFAAACRIDRMGQVVSQLAPHEEWRYSAFTARKEA